MHTGDLLRLLKTRFNQALSRHPGIDWAAVEARLLANPVKLASLAAMEATGGEPDMVGIEGEAVIFADCAPESPPQRRSLCYDRAALDARKENKPKGDVLSAAAAMGAELLDEAQYRALQALGEFDRKTSSWVLTPPAIRAQGGALFCDRRYGAVFMYHNGAESYYAARGFRCRLVV